MATAVQNQIAGFRSRELLLALAALVFTRVLTLPKTTWEFDESLFFQALQRYAPVQHHPPPPGYPLFIGVGKLFRAFIPSDFAALVTISFIASIVGFLALSRVARAVGGEESSFVAALLFYMSPAMLIHSTLPQSDSGALALYALALALSARAVAATDQPTVVAFAAIAAATVGWRPQMAIAVVPMFLVTCLLMRGWRARFISLGVFGLVCVLWLIPLVLATGSVAKLIAYETRQASYFAAHDADVSRSHWTPAMIALRFIAHPWGPKLLSFPILLVALGGFVAIVRERRRTALPLLAGTAVYLGVALAIMDPADGVRYALPAVLGVAILAAIGLVRLVPRLTSALHPHVLVAIYAAGAIVYCESILTQRRTTSSPPIAAVDEIRRSFPANTTVLYDLSLWPHAMYYLADRNPRRVDMGMRELYARPDRPLVMLADGSTTVPGSKTFSWMPSDAYSKLTRNHYRVVSVIPVPPHRRFAPIMGIFPPERGPEGGEWRWISDHGQIRLPPIPMKRVRLRLGLPVIYPMERNAIRVSIGPESERVELRRNAAVDVVLSVQAGESIVRFEPEQSFVPAALPASLNRDPRRLSVKLYDLSVE